MYPTLRCSGIEAFRFENKFSYASQRNISHHKVKSTKNFCRPFILSQKHALLRSFAPKSSKLAKSANFCDLEQNALADPGVMQHKPPPRGEISFLIRVVESERRLLPLFRILPPGAARVVKRMSSHASVDGQNRDSPGKA